MNKTCYNTILCLKYPFLYPRNRFTDEHYRNTWIHNKLWDIRKKYLIHFSINILTQEDFKKRCEQIKNDNGAITEISNSITYDDNTISIINNHNYFKLIVNGKSYSYKIADYLGKNLTVDDIEKISLVNRTSTNFIGEEMHKLGIWILLKEKENKHYYTFKSISVYTKFGIKYKVKFLTLINNFLKIFHILPSYSELDALEKGWRIKFGEDICKEIRNSLINTYIKNEHPNNIFRKISCYYKGIKLLFNYRIIQIKEKYGYLRWYDFNSTEDVHKIISKYEVISENTCIVCGKPATYHTTGWICPYCDEHKPQ